MFSSLKKEESALWDALRPNYWIPPQKNIYFNISSYKSIKELIILYSSTFKILHIIKE